MALLDPWDEHLEAVTALLNQLTGGSRTGPIALHAGEWRAEFRASSRSVTALLGPRSEAPPALSDYQLAIVYGLQLEPVGKAPATSFAKTLTIHEGYRWDEQMLREVVLEALAALRFAFGAQDAASAQLEDRTRASASGVLRGARRGKRRH